eukprot:jgi/Chlat1/8999/Chrsp94S00700
MSSVVASSSSVICTPCEPERPCCSAQQQQAITAHVRSFQHTLRFAARTRVLPTRRQCTVASVSGGRTSDWLHTSGYHDGQRSLRDRYERLYRQSGLFDKDLHDIQLARAQRQQELQMQMAVPVWPSEVVTVPEPPPALDIGKLVGAMFPFAILATACSAVMVPSTFTWFTSEYYAPALGGIMLSIGIQLSIQDFVLVMSKPMPVAVGVLAQYAIKPLLGLLAIKLFNLPMEFAAGLLVTACVSGAQLSSYATHLMSGDVALAVLLTALTTISSVAMTPLLTRFLLGSVVPVDMVAMSKSILQVVVVPICTGLFLNKYCKGVVKRIRPVMPLVAMSCTSLCIGSPLATNVSHLLSPAGRWVVAPVVAFHAAAFVIGMWFAKLPFFKLDDRTSRTLALCTGMQSSSLAVLLAGKFFGPAASIAPSISVVVMSMMGLSLGSIWGKAQQQQRPAAMGPTCDWPMLEPAH